MARSRDYKAEYQRRVASAAKRGLSRSQARGHARSDEAPIRSRLSGLDPRLEDALKVLRQSGNQAAAAKTVGVSPERFRRFLRENVQIEGRGPSLKIRDDRLRHWSTYSRGEIRELTLRGFDQASLNGEYLNAVDAYLSSNEVDALGPFVGRSLIDANGNAHPLETDPNTLHRLAHAGDAAFHEIYRLIL